MNIKAITVSIGLLLLTDTAPDYLYPDAAWEETAPEMLMMDAEELEKSKDYALKGGGSGIIIRNGKIVTKWGGQYTLYDLKSTTKSFGSGALGLAIGDDKLSLNQKAQNIWSGFGEEPSSNIATGWLDDITIKHLATMTAGFDKYGGYTELMFNPGTKWAYTDGGANWLADCLTFIYIRDLKELLFERVFLPIGINSSDLTWRDNLYRPDTINGVKRREFGSGISANVDAMARYGYLFLRKGAWKGQQIIPKEYVHIAGNSQPELHGLEIVETLNGQEIGAPEHYGLLWWNNSDGAINGIPTDTYWSWGLYDSWIIVIPSLDIVAVRAGATIPGDRIPNYKIVEGFLRPIVDSVK